MAENDRDTSPFRSVHTSNLPGILREAHISLAISTYQAGRVVIARSDGDVINTHFRTFTKPMGIAASVDRLAVGTTSEVHDYFNNTALANKIDPPGRHDACYLRRNLHVTGDVDIHEMARSETGELWFVNTRFSCLCTLDPDFSFVPRWQPSFISALSPTDRCHLNGLGMQQGQPRYVTALGATDSDRGWRDHKANGGVLIDIETNETIASGLSMPHSPRWYDDRLWILESGNGSIATVDPSTGTLNTLASLPGFTRGLDFVGPLAFVGLSQVRETAVFSGIPLTQRLDENERVSGVWVIDITNGRTVAFLRFEASVQEVFAVQVLPWRYPEILEADDERMLSTYAIPDDALARVPDSLRG